MTGSRQARHFFSTFTSISNLEIYWKHWVLIDSGSCSICVEHVLTSPRNDSASWMYDCKCFSHDSQRCYRSLAISQKRHCISAYLCLSTKRVSRVGGEVNCWVTKSGDAKFSLSSKFHLLRFSSSSSSAVHVSRLGSRIALPPLMAGLRSRTFWILTSNEDPDVCSDIQGDLYRELQGTCTVPLHAARYMMIMPYPKLFQPHMKSFVIRLRISLNPHPSATALDKRVSSTCTDQLYV